MSDEASGSDIILGSISVLNQRDVYRFSFDNDTRILFDVNGYLNAGDSVRIIDANGREIARNVDFDEVGGNLAFLAAAGQEYFVEIFNGFTSSGFNYELSVNWSPVSSSGFDGNDNLAEAAILQDGSSISDSHTSSNSLDYYTYTATADGVLSVDMFDFQEDLELRVYSAEGQLIAESLAAEGSPEQVRLSVQQGETFYFVSSTFQSIVSAAESYTISANLTPTVFQTDENVGLNSAQDITGATGVTTGAVGGGDGSDNTDFFELQTGNSQTLFVDISGFTANVQVSVLNESGDVVAQSTTENLQAEVLSAVVTPNSRYYVQVSAVAGVQTDFSLSTELFTTGRAFDFEFDTTDMPASIAAYYTGIRWTPGQTLGYSVDPGFSQELQQAIHDFFDVVSEVVNLNFVEDPNGIFPILLEDLEPNVLGQAFVVNPFGNTISIARDGLSRGTDDVIQTIQHEILHALGFGHANESPLFDNRVGLPFSLQADTFISQSSLANVPREYGGQLPSWDLSYLVALYGARDNGTRGDDTYLTSQLDPDDGPLLDLGGTNTLVIDNDINTVLLGEFGFVDNFVGAEFLAQQTDIAVVRFTSEGRASAVVGSDGAEIIDARQSVFRVNISGESGDDRIFGSAQGDMISSGYGSDVIVAGAGDDIITLFEGENRVTGENRVNAGAGNDTIQLGVDADIIDGGDGFDTVRVHAIGNANVNRLTGLNSGSTAGDTYTSIEAFSFATGDDIFVGNGNREIVLGGAGDDRIQGRGNHDLLSGGPEDDRLDGGGGNDVFFGFEHADTIINFNPNFDFIYLQSFDEPVLRTDGDDVLIELSFDATIRILNISLDQIDENIFLRQGDVDLDPFGGETRSGLGSETMFGTNLAESLVGDDGNQVFHGGFGHDLLTGAAGNDILIGGPGIDGFIYQGNDGDDEIRRFVNHFDFIDVSAVASSYSDLMVVVDGSNTLVTLPDGSTITLSNTAGQIGAEDFIFTATNPIRGFNGNDTLDGTSGADYIHAHFGDDVINAGAGDDILIGWGGVDTLNGGAGDDILNGGPRGDILDGGTGFDIADYRNSNAGVWVNLETGESQFNFAEGDTLISIEGIFGSRRNDRLTGDNGDNLLDGQDGIDFINGGTGNDTLIGGAGADTFVFDTAFGNDIIIDFEDGSDVLSFTQSGISFGDLTITQVGDDTVIEDADGNSITLEDVLATDITEDDFAFA